MDEDVMDEDIPTSFLFINFLFISLLSVAAIFSFISELFTFWIRIQEASDYADPFRNKNLN